MARARAFDSLTRQRCALVKWRVGVVRGGRAVDGRRRVVVG